MSTIEHHESGPRLTAQSPHAVTILPADADLSAVVNTQDHVLELRAMLTQKMQNFCDEYMRVGNVGLAYRHAYDSKANMAVCCNEGSKLLRHIDVAPYVAELRRLAAARAHIDVAALLQMDVDIVMAARHHSQELTQYVWECCRYCNGIDHKYQWISPEEYYAAIARWIDDCQAASMAKKAPPPQPSDAGGFGFVSSNDPCVSCPQCEGRGVQRAVINDTRYLSGPAAALYAGIEVTANGVKLHRRDPDKAMERILRVAGAFGDDGASVAKGAAAGAAAGAAVAAAVAKKTAEDMEAMTPEAAARAYKALIG